MSMSAPDIPPPPKMPTPAPPPPAPTGSASKMDTTTTKRKKSGVKLAQGTGSLRIPQAMSTPTKGSGLSIPKTYT